MNKLEINDVSDILNLKKYFVRKEYNKENGSLNGETAINIFENLLKYEEPFCATNCWNLHFLFEKSIEKMDYSESPELVKRIKNVNLKFKTYEAAKEDEVQANQLHYQHSEIVKRQIPGPFMWAKFEWMEDSLIAYDADLINAICAKDDNEFRKIFKKRPAMVLYSISKIINTYGRTHDLYEAEDFDYTLVTIKKDADEIIYLDYEIQLMRIKEILSWLYDKYPMEIVALNEQLFNDNEKIDNSYHKKGRNLYK